MITEENYMKSMADGWYEDNTPGTPRYRVGIHIGNMLQVGYDAQRIRVEVTKMAAQVRKKGRSDLALAYEVFMAKLTQIQKPWVPERERPVFDWHSIEPLSPRTARRK
jgi:hypothetical protein